MQLDISPLSMAHSWWWG